MTERILPTKAQYRLLVWMAETVERRLSHPPAEPTTAWERRQREFTGGDLIGYYEMVRKQDDPEGKKANSYGHGGYGMHGWRRAGGTALANLAKRGLVDEAGWTQTSIPLFRLNDAGRKALDYPPPAVGQVRADPGNGLMLVREQAKNGAWWISWSEFPWHLHRASARWIQSAKWIRDPIAYCGGLDRYPFREHNLTLDGK